MRQVLAHAPAVKPAVPRLHSFVRPLTRGSLRCQQKKKLAHAPPAKLSLRLSDHHNRHQHRHHHHHHDNHPPTPVMALVDRERSSQTDSTRLQAKWASLQAAIILQALSQVALAAAIDAAEDPCQLQDLIQLIHNIRATFLRLLQKGVRLLSNLLHVGQDDRVGIVACRPGELRK